MMKSYLTMTTALLALSVSGGGAALAQPPALAGSGITDAEIVTAAGAPLFQGMGAYKRKISTRSQAANRYFNQGMVLAFGFNHAESIRSFRAAQRLDPSCAMCFWGEALATGPNINVTSKGKAVMSDAERKAAFAAINRALALKDAATPLEQALIEAQAKRYNGDPATDRAPLDRAYADAMEQVVTTYPDDDDAAAIYSEALMNTMPWDYWSADGTPKPETEKVIAALERIITRSPEHPLALHLYIHAVEASAEPGRAEDEADTLANLVPGSGHLVHMPAHIYWRSGPRPWMKNISPPATRRDSIRQCIIRIISIFSGQQPAWRARAGWLSIRRARSLQMSGWSKSSNFRQWSSSRPFRC